jgi:hypothetical protein
VVDDGFKPLSVVDDGFKPLSVVDDGFKPLSVVDDGFKPLLNQAKDYYIGICCFFTKDIKLRSQDWLAWNQNNASE